MATMNLTTLQRLKIMMELGTKVNGVYDGSQPTQHDEKIRTLIQGVSGLIERYLGRRIRQQQYTDIYDMEITQRKIWVPAYPIAPILVPGGAPAQQVTIYYDIKRLFDVTITAEDYNNYGVDLNTGRITFEWPLNINRANWEKSMKVVYTGGMAPSLDRIVGTYSVSTGAPIPGTLVTGQISGFTGKVITFGAGAYIIQVTGGDGPPQVGEIADDGSGNTITLGTIDQDCLVDLFPELRQACENQVMFMFQRKDNIGLQSLSTEGGSISTEQPMQLTKMAKQMISFHRRLAVSA
jgi:hypothetical protein